MFVLVRPLTVLASPVTVVCLGKIMLTALFVRMPRLCQMGRMAVQGAYYRSSVAKPPYNTICVGSNPIKQPKSAEEKRVAIAEYAEREDAQLLPAPHRGKYAAVGTEKRTFEITFPSVSDSVINGLFKGGMGYAEMLWKAGFRLTIVTEGHEYWAAPLSADGYHDVGGPYVAEPTLESVAAEKAKQLARERGLLSKGISGFPASEGTEIIVTVLKVSQVTVVDRTGTMAERSLITSRLDWDNSDHKEWLEMICLNKQLEHGRSQCDALLPNHRYLLLSDRTGRELTYYSTRTAYPYSFFQGWKRCTNAGETCFPLSNQPIKAIRRPDGKMEVR
jgi:hypothetical protein